MQRRALIALVLAAGCTRSTAPKARLAGEVMSISGVVGLMLGALTSRYTSHTGEIMAGFSLVSAGGIGLYAAGDLTGPPPGPTPEPPDQMHRRWAKILTQRAEGAAREGNCRRVRRLEKRVNVYNREVHDFVFMKDPEIVKCLEAQPGMDPDADTPAVPRGLDVPLIPPATPAPDPTAP